MADVKKKKKKKSFMRDLLDRGEEFLTGIKKPGPKEQAGGVAKQLSNPRAQQIRDQLKAEEAKRKRKKKKSTVRKAMES